MQVAWVYFRIPIEGAKKFYGSVFGWTSETHQGVMPYTEFSCSGKSIAGMMEMMPGVPDDMPSYWMPYFGLYKGA